jgi:putative ABC transport system substrate-binding protein
MLLGPLLGQRMLFDTKRREFISLIGGAAITLPVAARAQQPIMPVIGFLHPTNDNLPDRLRGLRQGLKDSGYIEGENVTILYRWAENQLDRLPSLAAELVRRQVAVIVVTGSVAAFVAKAATTSVPIVFNLSEDPARLGLVASLARPGGNLTGVNVFGAELGAKRLELLRELVPATSRVALLVNPMNTTTMESTLRDSTAAASVMGLQILVHKASTSGDIDAAFDGFVREGSHALFVDPDPFFTSRHIQLVHLATRHAIPAIYAARVFAEAGGLMSYGAHLADSFRQMGAYAGRILKGAKPADLPVVQSSKFELVINAQTARTLRLTVPPMLLARADEVIE